MSTKCKLIVILLIILSIKAIFRAIPAYSEVLEVKHTIYHPKHAKTISALIKCESAGINISRLDSNGRLSDGTLQYNRGEGNSIEKGTWGAFSRESGIKGSPLIPEDAIRMTDWAIDHGKIGHWSCAHILGLVK